MDGSIRIVRGAVVGIAIMIVSGAFHTAAGGCADHLTSPRFVLLGVITVLIATLMSAHEWTMLRLLAAVGVGQFAFHYLVEGSSLFDAPGDVDVPNAAARWSNGAGMLLSHVLAALVIVLLLRRGEVWLLPLVALIGQVLLPLTPWAVTPVPAYPTTVPMDPRDSGFRRILFATAVARRGPPSPASGSPRLFDPMPSSTPT